MHDTALRHNDEELAVQATRDAVAFGALYQRYYGRIYTYVRYRCNDPEVAEDLVAQIFEQMLTHLKRFDPKRAPFHAWLFGIARNIVNRHRRRLHREKWMPLEALTGKNCVPEREIETKTLQSIEIEKLLRAIQGLDDEKRDLLALKFAGRFTNRQIAALTGLSESNVGVILFRTLDRLRAELEWEYEKETPGMETKHERA
jgi:RNA polymerase sigma-70 factor (ECF subfamily)